METDESVPRGVSSSYSDTGVPFAEGSARMRATLSNTRTDEVIHLGDAGSSPNAKTGAAVRKQAPVLVANLPYNISSQILFKILDHRPLFSRLVREQGVTLLMSSHDSLVDDYVDEVLHLQDGQIERLGAVGDSSKSQTVPI